MIRFKELMTEVPSNLESREVDAAIERFCKPRLSARYMLFNAGGFNTSISYKDERFILRTRVSSGIVWALNIIAAAVIIMILWGIIAGSRDVESRAEGVIFGLVIFIIFLLPQRLWAVLHHRLEHDRARERLERILSDFAR